MTTPQAILCALILVSGIVSVVVIYVGTEIACRAECQRLGTKPDPLPRWMRRFL